MHWDFTGIMYIYQYNCTGIFYLKLYRKFSIICTGIIIPIPVHFTCTFYRYRYNYTGRNYTSCSGGKRYNPFQCTDRTDYTGTLEFYRYIGNLLVHWEFTSIIVPVYYTPKVLEFQYIFTGIIIPIPVYFTCTFYR